MKLTKWINRPYGEVRERIRNHVGAEKIRISGTGKVDAYGSSDPVDFSKNQWRYVGYIEEVCAIFDIEDDIR